MMTVLKHWISLNCLVAVLFQGALCEVTLTAPSEYTVFTGPILLQFSGVNLTQPQVRVLELPSETVKEIIPLPRTHGSGEFEVQCGSIDYEGEFAFQIIEASNGENTVVKQSRITVRWPTFVLTIPPSQETLSSDVIVQFQVKNEIKCNSIYSDTKYQFEVIWFPEPSDQSYTETIAEVEVPQFLNLDSTPVRLGCSLFDQEGAYQVLFKSSRDPRNPITTSNQMSVSWNEDYAISTAEDHILPCTDSLRVFYTQPRCVGQEDKIRLFKQETLTSASAAERIEKYVTEFRASSGQSFVSFPCDMFEDSVIGYCFRYISFSRKGAAHEQDSICLSTQFVEVVDGNWSSWAEWSTCSQTCEGGVRTRHRICDNPKPSSNGNFCIGDSVETVSCGELCTVPTTINPYKNLTPDPKCPCGCQIADSKGTIVSSPNCLGSSMWIITAAKDHIIRLSFEHYTLSASNRHTEVYVRDGDSTKADLILKDNGMNPPRYVQTSQNKLWIEYLNTYDANQAMLSQDEGFVATFTSFPKNTTSGFYGTGIDVNTIWSSTLIVIVILLIICICVAVTCFVFYHRNNVKKKEKHLQQQIQNQSLLVNGEAHTSPTHSASHSSIKGSTNISFGDPAGTSPTHSGGKVKTPTSPSRNVNSSKARDYVIANKNGASKNKKDGKNKHKRSRSPNKKSGGNTTPNQQQCEDLNGVVYQAGQPQPQVSCYSSPLSTQRMSHDPEHLQPVYSISSHGYVPVSTLGSPAREPVSNSTGAFNNQPSTATSRSPYPNIRAQVKAPPLANPEEDLSPTTPVHDKQPVTYPGGQYIPMDSYYHNVPPNTTNNVGGYDSPYGNPGRIAETGMYSPHTKHKFASQQPQPYPGTPALHEGQVPAGKRPPVEGRDAVSKRHSKYAENGDPDKNFDSSHNNPYSNTTQQQQKMYSHDQLPHKGSSNNSHYYPPDYSNNKYFKPEVKSLPLRSIQRPDGQSPDTNTNEQRAPPTSSNPSLPQTPHSQLSNDLSPILNTGEKLFPDQPLSKNPSQMTLEFLPGENDFEYDDYVPDLPGSYFSMDPHAYTLTWSQKPGAGFASGGNKDGSQPGANVNSNMAAGQAGAYRTDSLGSLGPETQHSSMC